MFRAIFLVAVLVSVSNAYLPVKTLAALTPPIPSTGKIIGGVEARIEDVPYQVALMWDGIHACGGSIVKPKAVLTVAHCTHMPITLRDIPPSSISIRAGSSKHNFGGQVIQCSHYIRHELYSKNRRKFDYDIAIVALFSSISFSELAAPIALAFQGIIVPDGASALTSGWGNTVNEGDSMPVIVHKVEIPIVNQNICIEAYTKLERPIEISPRMICAGLFEEGGKDACEGDSGGPLVVENTLVGITSFGNECALPRFPGVWVRVSEVRNWIDEKLSKIR